MKKIDCLLLGIGNEAKQIIDKFYQQDRNFDFLCIDENKQFLNLSKIKTVWFNDTEYLRTKSDVEYHVKILRNKNNILKEELSNYKKVIITFYTGEETNLEIFFEILNYLKPFNMEYTILAVNPFTFDGESANNNAKMVMEKLKTTDFALGKNLFICDSNELCKEPKSIYSAHKKVRNKVLKVLKILVELNLISTIQSLNTI